MRLPFVSRYFYRSIGVRGRWNGCKTRKYVHLHILACSLKPRVVNHGFQTVVRECRQSRGFTGKSHPWTNTSVGGNCRELSGPLVHTNFPRNSYGPMIGPYEFSPKLVWTNGAQSFLEVSVLTGIGPWSALPYFRKEKGRNFM